MRTVKIFEWCVKISIGIIAILLISAVVILITDIDNPYQYETTNIYHVEKGDTLWSIADRNRTNDRQKIQQVVAEIRAINKITPDIQEGQKILIPNYTN